MAYKSPILFVFFNRMDTAIKVFSEIRKYKPNKLYVSADGPKNEKQSYQCANVRKAIIDSIDWDCEIKTNFQSRNLGMKAGVLSGINWFFEHEEEGIILEDDTMPNQYFFHFCSKMLQYYRDDLRIFHISGCNVQFGKVWGDGDYYYSRHPNIWGWATWKKAWKYYDPDLIKWPDFIKNGHFNDIMISDSNKWFYKFLINKSYKGFKAWGYQWSFAVQSQNGLCVTTNSNLIVNLGYGDDATTSSYIRTPLARLEYGLLPHDLKHPSFVIPSVKADYKFNKLTLRQVPLYIMVWRKFLKLLLNKK